jgi:hypothetical protein
MAARRTPSTVAAAPSCMFGIRWLQISRVIAIEERPSRSCTILGWTFDWSMWLAWLCRSLVQGHPHSSRRAETTCVRLRGCKGSPSSRVTTCRLSSERIPNFNNSSACAARQRTRNDYVIDRYVKAERVRRAIEDDLAFLAAHPTRRSINATKKRS